MRIDEHNFIQQLQQKNEDALMYVIDMYGGLIKAVIERNMTCLRSEQGECFNDVLLSVWDHIDSYRPEKNSFKNWVAAVAKYRAVDYMRKYKKELSEISYESLKQETGDAGESPEDAADVILETVLSKRTEELLSCLKEQDRELFVRLYMEEESVEHVSREVGMKPSAIYNRISRAKKKIRRRKGESL